MKMGGLGFSDPLIPNPAAAPRDSAGISRNSGARAGKDRGIDEKIVTIFDELLGPYNRIPLINCYASVNRPRCFAEKPPWAAPQGRGFARGHLLVLLESTLMNSSTGLSESTSLGSTGFLWVIPDDSSV
ncbi:hypothetical protein SCHPADRAFT_897281 [Schizopora paradoxa]|uniref:Uncharacterized protein n=1 Tax=Schizopora paradoxa TaxID=27342 RepID=A0A0H2QXM0_9AGAM|nr:hypothetical protein SCHPADRAFT_897281 [Schizopora paradoxa]